MRMRKHNFIIHVVVLGVLLSVGLGFYQAAEAVFTGTVATSAKFTGPEQPPSTWSISAEAVGLNAMVVAQPAAGAALIVQTIVFTNGESTPTEAVIYTDQANDRFGTCTGSSLPTDFTDLPTMVPASDTITEHFDPGIAVPNGSVLCSQSSSASALLVETVTGYNAAATAVPHVTSPRRAAPKAP
jgi:hypothetical protein